MLAMEWLGYKQSLERCRSDIGPAGLRIGRFLDRCHSETGHPGNGAARNSAPNRIVIAWTSAALGAVPL